MFIFTPPQRTAVFLARMVMPFSRSRSPESMTRSVISWWAPNAPVWRNMASTSVVLPWSTWATMATFLMSSRFCMGATTIGQVRGGSRRSPCSPLKRGGSRLHPGQGVSHRCHTRPQGNLIDLDLDQVARVGPPPHNATGWERARSLQRFHHRHHAELGSDGGAPRSPQHDQVNREWAPRTIHSDRTNLGAAPDGEKGGVWAVPPTVPADDGLFLERAPVQSTPQASGPRHGVGLHHGKASRGQAAQPSVQGRGGSFPLPRRTDRVRNGGPRPPG